MVSESAPLPDAIDSGCQQTESAPNEETQHVFLKTPYLCDLDTARYKGRLQSRNPGMTGISLHIDQHTKQ